MTKISKKLISELSKNKQVPEIKLELEIELKRMAKELLYQAEFIVKDDKNKEDILRDLLIVGIDIAVVLYAAGKLGMYDKRLEITEKVIYKYKSLFKSEKKLDTLSYLDNDGIRFYFSSCMIAGVLKGRDSVNSVEKIIDSSCYL